MPPHSEWLLWPAPEDSRKLLFPHFLNSLKIHQIETKEVMTDGVRISELNYQRFFRLYFFVFSSCLVSIEDLYETLETVWPDFQTLQSSSNRPFRVVNWTLFSVCELWSNTIFRVWCNGSSLPVVSRRTFQFECHFNFADHGTSPPAAMYETYYVTAHKAPCRTASFSPNGVLRQSFLI